MFWIILRNLNQFFTYYIKKIPLEKVNYTLNPDNTTDYIDKSNNTISNLRSKAQYEMRDTGGELDGLY